jgi:hypothetical protein
MEYRRDRKTQDRPTSPTLPVLTDDGARGALQRCPILRAGGEDSITRVKLAMVDLLLALRCWDISLLLS